VTALADDSEQRSRLRRFTQIVQQQAFGLGVQDTQGVEYQAGHRRAPVRMVAGEFPVARHAAPERVAPEHFSRTPRLKRPGNPPRFQGLDMDDLLRAAIQRCGRIEQQALHHTLG